MKTQTLLNQVAATIWHNLFQYRGSGFKGDMQYLQDLIFLENLRLVSTKQVTVNSTLAVVREGEEKTEPLKIKINLL